MKNTKQMSEEEIYKYERQDAVFEYEAKMIMQNEKKVNKQKTQYIF